MTITTRMKRILERMAQISTMERGKLCRMGGRPHYNHQTWQDGRNVVRYVPANETDFLQDAIDGYQRFMELAEQYADEMIKLTRRERKKLFAKQSKANCTCQSENAKKSQIPKIHS